MRFKAIDLEGTELAGIAEIKELKLDVMGEQPPAIYIFGGQLKMI